MAREYAKKFYRSKEWQGIRRAVLMRDNYLCLRCGEPATEVHHIEFVTADNVGNKATHIESNLQSLCRNCHCRIHDRQRTAPKKKSESNYTFDENGYPIPTPPIKSL